ncbi:hypothetical protein [Saccharopolyspora shandongensis]|uniref:hypothetical protein n=1 Tax=Saccharopolyspora shandongensis TaxID=418495 RepID=UPI003405946A
MGTSPNSLAHDDAKQQQLTSSLVQHVDSMDQAAKNVQQMNQQLQAYMQSGAGRTFNTQIEAWTQSYNKIKAKVDEVINNLGAAKKQIQAAEEDNQTKAAQFGQGIYDVLSKPHN